MRILKKIAIWLGVTLLLLGASVFVLYKIYVSPVLAKIEAANTLYYDDYLTIFEGGGGNTGVLKSDSLVLVIDSKMGDAAKELEARVKEIAEDRPILVVNTHFHIDHTQGNRLFKGQRIMAGRGYSEETWVTEAAKEDMPNQWLQERLDIPMGDDTVTLLTFNFKAHTVGDVFVYLHRRKMLFGGDVILNGQVPSINNGTPEGYLTAFDMLEKEFDIEQIVPGHGSTGGIEILQNFRQYFLDMKTAANDESKADELIDKYKDWTQVPLLMSSQNVVDAFKK